MNTSKLSKEDFELECKYQAEQTSERATSLSEWLALFDTVDSIVAQIPLISHLLAKPKRLLFLERWSGEKWPSQSPAKLPMQARRAFTRPPHWSISFISRHTADPNKSSFRP